MLKTHTQFSEQIPSLEGRKLQEITRIQIEKDRTLHHEKSDFYDVFRDATHYAPNESFYFLDEQELFERARIFQNYFLPEYDQRFIAYAVKANPLPRVLEILREAGIQAFDCASLGEVQRVQHIQPDAEIFFNNPCRSLENTKRAIALGVHHFTADTQQGIDSVLSPQKKEEPIEVSVRINPLDPTQTTAKIRLGEKFGLSLDPGFELLETMRHNQSILPGVSIHVGSQNFFPQTHAQNIITLSRYLNTRGVNHLNSFNIGGGPPVHLHLTKESNQAIIRDYLRTLSDSIEEAVDLALTPGGKCIIEPGRSMVAPTVDLAVSISEVIQNREGSNVMAIRIEDGILHSFTDRALHNWDYVFRAINKQGKPVEGPLVRAELHGWSCDEADRIKDIWLPENISKDDYLWVPHAGAYLSCQSSHFNGHAPHQYIAYNPI